MDHYLEHIEDWRKAGEISAKVLAFGRELIKPGAKVVDVLDKVEEKIAELGAKPAFPPQISLNEVAAHFCPEADDETVLSDQVVKLDVGCEFNGAIGDNACTVDLSGKHQELVEASKAGLQAAINTVKAGATLGEIGKAIETAIKEKGFQPVVNLSGHGLDYYTIHCKPTIPNFDNGSSAQVEEGMVFAIEPFATSGVGRIQGGGQNTLYEQIDKKPMRERDVLAKVESFNNLPFTTRWFKGLSPMKVKMALRKMVQIGMLAEHPPLIEVSGGLVSQAEHTVLVKKDGCEVLTNPKDL